MEARKYRKMESLTPRLTRALLPRRFPSSNCRMGNEKKSTLRTCTTCFFLAVPSALRANHSCSERDVFCRLVVLQMATYPCILYPDPKNWFTNATFLGIEVSDRAMLRNGCYRRGCAYCHAWPSSFDHRPSHPYSAGTKNVGFSPTGQTLLAPPSAKRNVRC